MSETLDRAKLLAKLGFGHPEAQARAVEVLTAAKLTRANKTGIAAYKREQVEVVLSSTLVPLCGRCRQRERLGGREAVPAAPEDCQRCGGSPNQLAVDQAAAACRQREVRRILVVGGSPGARKALRQAWPKDLALRLLNGTRQQTAKQARQQIHWADLVIIWGASELAHSVSSLYTQAPPTLRRKVITARRRGVEALCQRLLEHLGV